MGARQSGGYSSYHPHQSSVPGAAVSAVHHPVCLSARCDPGSLGQAGRLWNFSALGLVDVMIQMTVMAEEAGPLMEVWPWRLGPLFPALARCLCATAQQAAGADHPWFRCLVVYMGDPKGIFTGLMVRVILKVPKPVVGFAFSTCQFNATIPCPLTRFRKMGALPNGHSPLPFSGTMNMDGNGLRRRAVVVSPTASASPFFVGVSMDMGKVY